MVGRPKSSTAAPGRAGCPFTARSTHDDRSHGGVEGANITDFPAGIPPGNPRSFARFSTAVATGLGRGFHFGTELARTLLDTLHPATCLGCDDLLTTAPLAARAPLSKSQTDAPGDGRDLPTATHPGRRARIAAPPLCGDCVAAIQRAPTCPRCSDQVLDARHCPICTADEPIQRLRVFGLHQGVLRRLIVAAKWSARPEPLLPLLTRFLVDESRTDGWNDGLDGWCTVPRDFWRRLRHGPPVTRDLGAGVGAELGLPPVHALARRRRPPQAALSGATRRQNLIGTFRVPARRMPRVAGRRLLLVDDVITTGSTLRECHRALMAAGALEVRALVLAYRP